MIFNFSEITELVCIITVLFAYVKVFFKFSHKYKQNKKGLISLALFIQITKHLRDLALLFISLFYFAIVL